MAEAFTRATLFVPGVASEAAGAKALKGLAPAPEFEWIANDGTFGQAFSYGTVDPDVIARLEAAAGTLVLYWTIDLREGRKEIVAAIERLRDAGAIAVRLEQSKLGWEISRWIEVFSSDDAWAWHRAAVTLLSGDGALQSCGMHAFSLPDVKVEDAELASTFNVYQLAEDPVLRSGQTFAPDRETPRRVIQRWPDTQYPAGHACHNPYGVWRLGPPGGKSDGVPEFVLTFVPALQAVLLALEAKRGKQLTRTQVEAARDEGTCIAMEPLHAQKLERERGYADLDPELVWEQWTLVRPGG